LSDNNNDPTCHGKTDYRAATGLELHPAEKLILVVINYKILFQNCYADFTFTLYTKVCVEWKHLLNL
jgi:hypothetical protein